MKPRIWHTVRSTLEPHILLIDIRFFPGQTLVILRSPNCAVDTAYASQCSKYQEMSNMTPRILTAAPAQYDAHVSLLMGRPFGLTAKPF